MFATVGRERVIRGCDKGRWAAGGEKGWRAEARRKESGKVGQGHDGRTAARREGIFAGRKEESASGVGGRVEVGVWIVGRDKMHGAALCCTALAP